MYIRFVFCLLVIYHLTSEGALAVRSPAELPQPNQKWPSQIEMSPSLEELSRKFDMRVVATTPLAVEDTDMDDYVEIIDQHPFQTNLYKSPHNSIVSNVIALSKNKPLNDKKPANDLSSVNVDSTIRRLNNQLEQERQKVEKLYKQLNQVKISSPENDFNSRPFEFGHSSAYRRGSNKKKLLKSIPKGERPSLNGNKRKSKDKERSGSNLPRCDLTRLNKSTSYLTEGYFGNEHSNSDFGSFRNTDKKFFRKEDIMNKFYPLLFNESLKDKERIRLVGDQHRLAPSIERGRPEDIYLTHMKKLTAPYDVFPMKSKPKTKNLSPKNLKRGAETGGLEKTTKQAKLGSEDEEKGDEQVNEVNVNEVINSHDVFPIKDYPDTINLSPDNRKREVESDNSKTVSEVKFRREEGKKQTDQRINDNVVMNSGVLPVKGMPKQKNIGPKNAQAEALNTISENNLSNKEEKAETGEIHDVNKNKEINSHRVFTIKRSPKTRYSSSSNRKQEAGMNQLNTIGEIKPSREEKEATTRQTKENCVNSQEQTANIG